MMKALEQAAEAYQEAMRKVDDNSTYDSIDVDVIRHVAFKAGAEWQKQKAIEAFRVMGERTRFDIPTDVLIKAREIFIEELNR